LFSKHEVLGAAFRRYVTACLAFAHDVLGDFPVGNVRDGCLRLTSAYEERGHCGGRNFRITVAPLPNRATITASCRMKCFFCSSHE
jgi:hypothetical protein